MQRTDVSFSSGNDTCAAWLYRPEREGSVPVIVMAHGLAGVKEQRLDAFAERFVAAGYACLVFDYRHFGASGGSPRQVLDIATQRADWRAAVAFARTLSDIAPDRVVVWGTSFGGGHVIVTAAEDPRIVAAIAQCPFTDGLASGLATPPLTSVRVTARGIRDAVGARLGRDPRMVPSYADPGEVGLMTAPDCRAGVEALNPAGFAAQKDVAARFALQIVRSFPGRRAKDVRVPLHVAIAEQDSVAPAGRTRHHVSKAPKVEIASYDCGHFDIYVGEWFERNVADQLAFLKRHVPVG